LATDCFREADAKFPTPPNLSQAKFLVHQFLFARVVCSDLVLKPWAFGIGAPIPPGKVEVNNLRYYPLQIEIYFRGPQIVNEAGHLHSDS